MYLCTFVYPYHQQFLKGSDVAYFIMTVDWLLPCIMTKPQPISSLGWCAAWGPRSFSFCLLWNPNTSHPSQDPWPSPALYLDSVYLEFPVFFFWSVLLPTKPHGDALSPELFLVQVIGYMDMGCLELNWAPWLILHKLLNSCHSSGFLTCGKSGW